VTTISSSSIQVLDPHLPGIVGDDAATRVGVLVADRRHLGGDHATQLGVVGQNRFQFGDGLAQLGHLFFELGAPQSGEATERHVEDVLGLGLAEGERLRHQRRAGRWTILGTADGGDHRIEHVDGPQQALDDVGPFPSLAELELGPPGDDLDLVVDVVLEGLGQVERPG